jgi:DNA-binding winged helix-turn-helix (wHTH) protein
MSVQLDSAVGERLRFGEFELAPVARALWRRDEQIKLGTHALDRANLFMGHASTERERPGLNLG